MLARVFRKTCNSHSFHDARLSRAVSCASKDSPEPDGQATVATDKTGIPLKPTWSVHKLIESYPSPSLSDETITNLHRLAALVPPEKGTEGFDKLKKELEDLVRVVEAVRVASGVENGGAIVAEGNEKGMADGRIWPKDHGVVFQDEEELDRKGTTTPPQGRELLELTRRTKGEFYVVDSSKSKLS